ncbi:MAG: hypothetical protein CO128_03570 [Ignavibacteriales bacterium CG_4_9_14_3_um_filter_30_11]|nr:MAG: hypothetical protein CO128_03570 [Ignavibacteriales bacterium CG_4_9_14_3_um_filter_30_11]
MQYLISLLIGYLIGSIPTAYLLLKLTKGIDIRESGSGNVGALNSLETSNSKIIGLIVLVIDFLKGFLVVLLIITIYTKSFMLPALGLCSGVLSHNFNPWLKFKGGRGLATAAGGSSLMFPFLLVVWCVLWMFLYLYKRNIIIANFFSTLLSAVLIISISNIAIKYSKPIAENKLMIVGFTILLLFIILTKHIKPFVQEIKSLNLTSKGNKNEK